MRPLFPLIVLTLGLCGCPPDLEVAPATVTIDGFDLTTEPGQGGPTAAITEVWVFAEDDFLGVFPLPARIPVFSVGPTRLRFEAGVHRDGRSVTPDVYPFYAPVSRSVELTSAQTTDLGTLPLTYLSEARFAFVEGFEGEPIFPVVVQDEVVRSGGAAGAVVLTDSSALQEITTLRQFSDLNRVPITVWLEVDYLSEAGGVFGVVGSRGGESIRQFDPGFRARTEWTKLYFDLSPVIGSADLDALSVSLSLLLPNDRERASVYLDNLKLLYLRP